MTDRDTPEQAAAAIIQVDGIAKSFGATQVLRGVNFSVQRGTTCCILGGSGGGKSTLLKVMIGVLKPTAGRVILDGDDLCGMKPRELDLARRKFGVMFQSGALLNSMTIRENVALPLAYHSRLDADTIDTTVKIKLMQVDLLHAADRRPSEISGGMQKRAAVARCLPLTPKCCFMTSPPPASTPSPPPDSTA